MKKGIHPKNIATTIKCASCGNTFETLTTLSTKEMAVDVCAKCHPFYTGAKGGAISAKGRVEKLSSKFESGINTLKSKPQKTTKRVKANKNAPITSFEDLAKKS